MTLYEALEKYTQPMRGNCTVFENIGAEVFDNEKDFALYNLIRDVSSIKMEVTIKDVELQPGLVLKNGSMFGPEDISEDGYGRLKELDFNKLPVYIRCKIADILWIKRKESKPINPIDVAKVAVNAYLELIKSPDMLEKHREILSMAYRAVAISKQINSKDLCNTACELIQNLIVVAIAKGKKFLAVELLEILVEQKISTSEFIISELNEIISDSLDSFHILEKTYLVLESFYESKKDSDALKSTRLSLAKLYESESEKLEKNNHQNIFRATCLLGEALKNYRNNKEPDEADRVQREIIEMQSKLRGIFPVITQYYDTSKTYDYLEKNFRRLSLEESILLIARLTIFFKKEDIKDEVVRSAKEGFSVIDFEKIVYIGDRGHIIRNLEMLDHNNPESNSGLLDDYIRIYLKECESRNSDLFLYKALEIIQRGYDFTADSFDFLVLDNGLIPDGRERIFKSAISMALHGQYYEAIHILAPQMENLFRELANVRGDLAYTLESDGTSKAKVLSSVLDLPRLNEALGSDIKFIFEGLLNEELGGNIRNEAAHGLLTEKKATSGVCVYFICAVIKLLSFGSQKCNDIEYSSKNLKSIEKPSEDMLPQRIEGLGT